MSDFEENNILVDATNFKKRIIEKTKWNTVNVIARSFFGFVTLLVIFCYLMTPLGKVKIANLSGNLFLSKDQVLEIASLSEEELLLSVNKEDVTNKLNKSPYIASSQVDWHITHLDIFVDEIAPVAKSGTEILLTNGLYLSKYQLDNPTYKVTQDIIFPEYLSFVFSNDSKNLLHSLKKLSRDLYSSLVYLDERMVTLAASEPTKYFGLYFKTENEKLFRIQINHQLIEDALSNTNVLNMAVNRYDEFSIMHIEEIDLDVYNAIYSCQGNACSVKNLIERE